MASKNCGSCRWCDFNYNISETAYCYKNEIKVLDSGGCDKWEAKSNEFVVSMDVVKYIERAIKFYSRYKKDGTICLDCGNYGCCYEPDPDEIEINCPFWDAENKF